MLVELRKCDIIQLRSNNEGGRGSRRTFGSERDAGLSPCRCLSNQEVPLGALSGVAAATQYPGGGVWTYGASNGGAFSNYYHGSKYHSSTVVSRWTSKSSKAYAYAGQTSYAFIKTSFGEQAAFYYNYN